MASNQLIKLITIGAVAVTKNQTNPFRPFNPIRASSVGAGILFGANHPGRNTDRYIRFDVPVSWDQAVIESGTSGAGIVINPNLADGLIDANAGTVLAAEVLDVIALVNGQPITRVSFDDTVAAGEFLIRDNGGITTIDFGTAYGVGTKIEILLVGSADTGTGVTNVTGTLVAGVPQQVLSYGFVHAGASARTL